MNQLSLFYIILEFTHFYQIVFLGLKFTVIKRLDDFNLGFVKL